ncbi:MAG TPA: diguanylate cyclase [Alphaproteobacteria bacterium]|nr:diguanylate cyclase [Alphaproteobacteria bacterium]
MERTTPPDPARPQKPGAIPGLPADQARSDALRAKLQEIQQAYELRLAELVESVETGWAGLAPRGGAVAPAELQPLTFAVHNIAGSAGTFGYAAVSKLATALEVMLRGLGGPGDPAAEEKLAQIGIYVQALAEAWRRRDPPKQPLLVAEPEPAPPPPPLVHVVEPEAGRARLLEQQLAQFGYEVATFPDMATASAAAAQQAPAVVVAALDRPTGAPAPVPGDVPQILLGPDGSFETRLAAVRAGGVAFLSYPLDIDELLYWTDHLTRGRQIDPYRILIVDDDPYLGQAYAMTLQSAGMVTELLEEPARLLEVLGENTPDLILMDVYMPGCTGVELAQVVRQQQAFVSIPIVFLSVETDTTRQLVAKRLGGDDFLTKPIRPSHLIAAVASRAERARALREVMERDSLTGLLNHARTKERLEVEIARARRDGQPLSLALIDLDHFKAVNDLQGHLAGDRVIKSLATMLHRRLRRTDVVGRYGGEEFCAILPNTTPRQAQDVLEKIRRAFAQVVHRGEEDEFRVTLSGGIAALADRHDPSGLIADADRALYAAKAAGRNRLLQADAAECGQQGG